MSYIETSLSGYDLINQPMLNKGTAFSDEERDIFGCMGCCRPCRRSGKPDQAASASNRSTAGGIRTVRLSARASDSDEALFYALLEAIV